MERIDCTVVGAGALGLAVARALARAGREVVILEAAAAIGTEVSSRNSGVIHAGIYYPNGSVKARVCVTGKHALYRFCESHGVPYQRCGKLIVATDESQIPALEKLEHLARGNGVDDLRFLGAKEARALEPELECVAAILSPSTGILDVHAYLIALLGDAESNGAALALNAPLLHGEIIADGVRLEVGGEEGLELETRLLVNCAGLGAQAVAGAIRGFPEEKIPRRYLAKGNYFTLAARAPFRHLVYPMPDGAWLGVHSTLDLGGRCKFGPDIQWVDEIDYAVDTSREGEFYAAIRRYWPGLEDGALQPDYSGIRPKLYAEGEPPRDFHIQGPPDHGVGGIVNLFGIESPGLTSSLAIADEVLALAGVR
ncbi:MAG: NAD(P)/FAD-dependent oxidoreductase [Gammaproteobacteria bacterium]|nr:NAD(P)/FAD-dependent oxidoreductase [Gammaproteobacteria bacterium]